MNITVVIPFYQNAALLSIALDRLEETVAESTILDKLEILVVHDNPAYYLPASTLGRDRVTAIYNLRNTGYGAACNVGAENARYEHLIFMDSDIVPTNGWLEALLSTRNAHSGVGAVGARILDIGSGRLLHFGVAFHEIDVINPLRNSKGEHPLLSSDRRAQAVPSGLMLVNRTLFRAMNGFDPRFFNAYTDLDFCCRLREQGYECWVSVGCIALHRGTVSGEIRYAHHSDTKALFFRRWGRSLQNDGLEILRASCRIAREGRLPSSYLAINLSNSLFYEDYLKVISEGLNIVLADVYSCPTRQRHLRHIQFEDHLSSTLIRLRQPLLYLVDNFLTFKYNQHWVQARASWTDLVVDLDCNVLKLAELGNK